MRRHSSAFACVLLLITAFAAPASAQKIPNDRFAANRFTPAPGGGNYIMVDGSSVAGHLAPTLGLFVDYAHRPFVVFTATCRNGDEDNCELDEAAKEIISYQVTFNAMATLSLWQRLQIGLVLPAALIKGDSFAATSVNTDDDYVDIRGGRAFGLGDPRLSAK